MNDRVEEARPEPPQEGEETAVCSCGTDGTHWITCPVGGIEAVPAAPRPEAGETAEDDGYCETCDDEHWIPNDDADRLEDDPFKPCPDCNPKGAIPCPYVQTPAVPEPETAAWGDMPVEYPADPIADRDASWMDGYREGKRQAGEKAGPRRMTQEEAREAVARSPFAPMTADLHDQLLNELGEPEGGEEPLCVTCGRPKPCNLVHDRARPSEAAEVTVEAAFKDWYATAPRRRRARFFAFEAGVEYARRASAEAEARVSLYQVSERASFDQVVEASARAERAEEERDRLRRQLARVMRVDDPDTLLVALTESSDFAWERTAAAREEVATLRAALEFIADGPGHSRALEHDHVAGSNECCRNEARRALRPSFHEMKRRLSKPVPSSPEEAADGE